MASIELSSSLFYPMYLELYQGIMYIFGCFRLTDCIELLQSMERKGLLDMDKVDLRPSYLSSFNASFFLEFINSALLSGLSRKVF